MRNVRRKEALFPLSAYLRIKQMNIPDVNCARPRRPGSDLVHPCRIRAFYTLDSALGLFGGGAYNAVFSSGANAPAPFPRRNTCQCLVSQPSSRRVDFVANSSAPVQ